MHLAVHWGLQRKLVVHGRDRWHVRRFFVLAMTDTAAKQHNLLLPLEFIMDNCTIHEVSYELGLGQERHRLERTEVSDAGLLTVGSLLNRSLYF